MRVIVCALQQNKEKLKKKCKSVQLSFLNYFACLCINKHLFFKFKLKFWNHHKKQLQQNISQEKCNVNNFHMRRCMSKIMVINNKLNILNQPFLGNESLSCFPFRFFPPGGV